MLALRARRPPWREAARAALRRARTRALAARGREIKSTAAMVSSPRSTVRPARSAAPSRFDERGREARNLEIRAGVHTGECELRRETRSGASRSTSALASLTRGGPGEVLVLEHCQGSCRGSGIGFDDRGTHVLKGVPGMSGRSSLPPMRRTAGPPSLSSDCDLLRGLKIIATP